MVINIVSKFSAFWQDETLKEETKRNESQTVSDFMQHEDPKPTNEDFNAESKFTCNHVLIQVLI